MNQHWLIWNDPVPWKWCLWCFWGREILLDPKCCHRNEPLVHFWWDWMMSDHCNQVKSCKVILSCDSVTAGSAHDGLSPVNCCWTFSWFCPRVILRGAQTLKWSETDSINIWMWFKIIKVRMGKNRYSLSVSMKKWSSLLKIMRLFSLELGLLLHSESLCW